MIRCKEVANKLTALSKRWPRLVINLLEHCTTSGSDEESKGVTPTSSNDPDTIRPLHLSRRIAKLCNADDLVSVAALFSALCDDGGIEAHVVANGIKLTAVPDDVKRRLEDEWRAKYNMPQCDADNNGVTEAKLDALADTLMKNIEPVKHTQGDGSTLFSYHRNSDGCVFGRDGRFHSYGEMSAANYMMTPNEFHTGMRRYLKDTCKALL